MANTSGDKEFVGDCYVQSLEGSTVKITPEGVTTVRAWKVHTGWGANWVAASREAAFEELAEALQARGFPGSASSARSRAEAVRRSEE